LGSVTFGILFLTRGWIVRRFSTWRTRRDERRRTRETVAQMPASNFSRINAVPAMLARKTLNLLLVFQGASRVRAASRVKYAAAVLYQA
jgi:hypothetical protein